MQNNKQSTFFSAWGISAWHPYWQWELKVLMESAKPTTAHWDSLSFLRGSQENVRQKINNVLLFALQPKKHSCGIFLVKYTNNICVIKIFDKIYM